MATPLVLPRKILAYSVSIVLALVMGYLMAKPDDLTNLTVVVAVVGLVLLPALIRWYHPLMIFSVNAFITFSFLPGRPELWIVAAGIGLTIALINRSLVKLPTSLHVPAVSWSLVLLAVVTFITAGLTTGIGFRAVGAETYGGKRYIQILAAIMAYFVLVSQPILRETAKQRFNLFCGSAITAVVSNLIYFGGPAFFFLYYLFPAELAITQASADFSVEGLGMVRATGLAAMCNLLLPLPIAHWGLRGTLDLRRPWRLVLVLLLLLGGISAGYRSVLVGMMLFVGVAAMLEGFYKTRLLPFLIVAVTLASALVLPNAQRLPLVLQRTLSVLPMANVDPAVRVDAEESSEWRVQMWNYLLPQIPQHLILGRGFGIDATQHYLLEQSAKRGLLPTYEISALTGAFHNGPLSVLLPLGLFGLLTFAWFCAASLWVLTRNFRYGDASLGTVNTALLAMFIGRLLFFCLVYGAFENDLPYLVGVVGFSISLNGVRKPPSAQNPAAAFV